ncbi:MAG: Re/Si-specific NAD(P)(+) transhydrogenase subunit alpha [Planctomycetota bacterium]
MATVFVPKESTPGETRVSLVHEGAKHLAATGLTVLVESGAGAAARSRDADYEKAGAKIAGREGWANADLVLKVQPPTVEEAARLKSGAILVCFVYAASRRPVVDALLSRGISTLAMELVPRITRAQAMDALSSQATIAGYKAVLVAAERSPRLFPLLMTAAGTITPARVVVFGAGVAGLQAIATARRLGAIVEATDVRYAAKEQVESLGGRFIEVPGLGDLEGAGGYAKEASAEVLARQREVVGKKVAEADVVITTALVPGKPAPKLVGADMVRSMKPGAVLVDMAVESGGNCELSELGAVVEKHGVTIVGIPNLPATVPMHASELYSKNVLNMVKLFVDKEGRLSTEFKDEVLAGALLTHQGKLVHEATAKALGMMAVGA